MIVLRSRDLLALVDPAHGAEIVQLLHVPSGSCVLGAPPFPPAAPAAGELDEETWTAAYRGGWQLAVPNAGNACTVGGVRHGFHGGASTAAWTVEQEDGVSATMRWQGHGLVGRRTVRVDGRGLISETGWSALADRAPLVLTEHLVLGRRVLVPDVRIDLPAGVAWELSEREGPVRAPAGASRWPELRLLDGGTERADTFPAAETRGRFAVVADVPEGRARIGSAATGWEVQIEWDERTLPHVWVWHELRASGGIWRGQGELLGIEPATVPHSLGLECAIAEGQAVWVEPGETLRTSVRLSVHAPG